MEHVLKPIWDTILALLRPLFWWIIFFPVVMLLSLPFVLLIAFFRPGRYDQAVFNLLGGVCKLWAEWGWWVVA